MIKKFVLAGSMALLLIMAVDTKSHAQTTTTTTTTTVTTTTTASAPVKSSSPTIFVEFGGPGLAFSGNFDTRFSNTRRDGLGGRVGLGFISEDGASIFTAPVQLNYLMGKNGKYFEVGAGATYASLSDKRSDDFLSFNGSGMIGTMTFGYRSQPVDGGFNFRVSFNPLFNSHNFVPYLGLSFGYTLK